MANASPHTLFSILVANYNNGRFFKDCYESILAQTYSHWEVIIVDDQSTDDSVQQINALITDDRRFKFVKNDRNRGCGYSKRRCTELATGTVCAFLDPDDALLPEALALMVEAHAQQPGAALVHSTLYFCDESLNIKTAYQVPRAVNVSERFTNLEAKVTAFSSFKKKFYDNTEGINPEVLRAVDQDLYLKLSEQGPFYYLDQVLYKYRVHGNGISTANAEKALYWFLKVIADAERRRGVSLENEVAAYLNRISTADLKQNLDNPRYLILQLLRSCKKLPSRFIKKLLFNK